MYSREFISISYSRGTELIHRLIMTRYKDHGYKRDHAINEISEMEYLPLGECFKSCFLFFDSLAQLK